MTSNTARTAAATAAASARRKATRLARLADELSSSGWTVAPPDGGRGSYAADAESYARDMINHVPQEHLVAATIAMTLGEQRHSFRAILDEALSRWKNAGNA